MRPDGVIFLLENSTDYLFLLDQAFRSADVHNPLRVARYGNEAVLYLKGVGIYGDRKQYPLPKLIVLDLAVPDGSGLAVLGWIRRQPEFNSIPIIILVAPQQTKYLQDAFDQGANAHYASREDFKGLAEMIKSIELVSDEAPKPESESPARTTINTSAN